MEAWKELWKEIHDRQFAAFNRPGPEPLALQVSEGARYGCRCHKRIKTNHLSPPPLLSLSWTKLAQTPLS